ncbi:unnamed protein product [Urochloa humidicola]
MTGLRAASRLQERRVLSARRVRRIQPRHRTPPTAETGQADGLSSFIINWHRCFQISVIRWTDGLSLRRCRYSYRFTPGRVG